MNDIQTKVAEHDAAKQMLAGVVRECALHDMASLVLLKLAAAQADTKDVIQLAQAILTALNVGNVESGSVIHLKLREVMIAYRARIERSHEPKTKMSNVRLVGVLLLLAGASAWGVRELLLRK